MTLSPRLQAVLDFCQDGFLVDSDSMHQNHVKSPLHNPDCGILADIGTDHAYLPIAAVRQGICGGAIACDLHPGPLAMADENIRGAGLEGQIETRLGDGLTPLGPGEADCIVIAGMGGMRIWGIILEGMEQARAAKRLILQPQHDIVLLRKNLHGAGFEIQGERLVREVVGGKEHFYVVLVARYTGDVAAWTEREYFLGKFLIERGGADFSAYVAHEREKISNYVSSINDKNLLCDVQQRLDWLTI